MALVRYFYMYKFGVTIGMNLIVYHCIGWSLAVPLQRFELFLILQAVKPDMNVDMLFRMLIDIVIMLLFGYMDVAKHQNLG